ncbi:MAG: class I SAM-dependent methyltransferase, partial [Alphaproteobacteria bacterium]|nr:class I SAM-dependent methyltransferase [Alphaproteobacteria bacterium]
MKALKRELRHTHFLYKQGGTRKILDHIKENVVFDIENGINTSSWLDKDDFIEHPHNFVHGVKYRASATNEVLPVLQKVAQIIDVRKAGFYDLGCGKGKILCLAGRDYDYSEIVGVDYYEPFIQIAHHNLKVFGLNCVNLCYGDMSEYKSFKETSVIYLYNPAERPIIEKVKKNLEEFTKKAIVI